MRKDIDKCRICGNQNLQTVFDLGQQYLTGRFPASVEETITSGPVELVKCCGDGVCGLVQLRQSYDLDEMYGDNYGYRSGLNLSMIKHLHGKVDEILGSAILREGDLVVDIGSNDATTLNRFPAGKFRLIGIDPSAGKFEKFYRSDVTLVKDFFSRDALVSAVGADLKAKLITSYSMFYDLEDPLNFMREIEESLDDEGIWIFEQSYLPKMIDTNSFDTICHEHLEFYTLKQIVWMASKAKLKVVDVEFNDVNGGSFSVTVAKINSRVAVDDSKINSILEQEKMAGYESIDLWEDFTNRVDANKRKLIDFLTEAKRSGKRVCGIGASTKGNVLLQYYGIGLDLIESIGEVNEDKFNHFTPGTKIPLIPEDDVLESKPDYLVVFPWHFKDFFLNSEKFKDKKLVFPLPNFEIINT